MTESSLYSELERIGIDKELAHRVSASLDPDYNASKKDVLVMQEAIMQVQLQSERNASNMRSDMQEAITHMQLESERNYSNMRSDMQEAITQVQLKNERSYNELRSEIHDVHSNLHAINRQFIITFGGMLVTIATVVAVNWYFHWELQQPRTIITEPKSGEGNLLSAPLCCPCTGALPRHPWRLKPDTLIPIRIIEGYA